MISNSLNLEQRLSGMIQQHGPMPVSQYMNLCLLDPRHGYYPTRDPIGAGADFITAPEVSQIFGELIGIWLANGWQEMGKPKSVHLVEAGPGKGTMMSDILRTAGSIPAFSSAIQVHLLEASAALVAVQAETLGGFAQPLHWADSLNETGSGPLLLVANEYLDCLPVRQFVTNGKHWFERYVGLDPTGALQFVLGQIPLSDPDIALIPPALRKLPDHNLVEIRPGLTSLVDQLAQRAKSNPVLALFIDYGPARSEAGDSLQAISAHQKVNPLQRPGEVDITARVDFEQFALDATAAGLLVTPPVSQRSWLQKMGLLERAASLSSQHTDNRAKIARQVHRLTDPDEMGELFRIICVYSPDLPVPAGFDV